jgi:hypothetical protein
MFLRRKKPATSFYEEYEAFRDSLPSKTPLFDATVLATGVTPLVGEAGDRIGLAELDLLDHLDRVATPITDEVYR